MANVAAHRTTIAFILERKISNTDPGTLSPIPEAAVEVDEKREEPLMGEIRLSKDKKAADEEEVKKTHSSSALLEPSSYIPVPPPPPVHRRSPIPRKPPEDDEDMVSETSDSSMLIRMTPHLHGEEMLSVELGPEEVAEHAKAQEEKELGKSRA
ncbi:hypothetical protein AAFF_G00089790 [Aldrovandia affinis]|uniref:Uncharacterized protein n=1 Tax=Aldrovandia affinis TaxID=143900 RepID=A0AAD7WCW9_9TELE|nr:hypothetical protein AAFF_G00089790 [Aldrovandia affinis]